MSSSLPLDGVKVFLHIRDGIPADAKTAPVRAYDVRGTRRAHGSPDAVRRRTRKLVKQLGGTLCLSEQEADVVLCYNATDLYVKKLVQSGKQLLDPAYVEACAEKHTAVNSHAFTLVLQPVDHAGSPLQVASPPRAHMEAAGVATPPLTPAPHDSGRHTTTAADVATAAESSPPSSCRPSSRRTPVKRVHRDAFGFDSETTPNARDTTCCVSRGDEGVATAAGNVEVGADHTPPLSASCLAASPTACVARHSAMPLTQERANWDIGGTSTSTCTLTPQMNATPPTMEEVRHAVLRAAVARPRAMAATQKRSQKRREETGDEQLSRSEHAAASCDDAEPGPTRRGRADPFLVPAEDLVGVTPGQSGSSLPRSHTPTPRVTQRLVSIPATPSSPAESVAVAEATIAPKQRKTTKRIAAASSMASASPLVTRVAQKTVRKEKKSSLPNASETKKNGPETVTGLPMKAAKIEAPVRHRPSVSPAVPVAPPLVLPAGLKPLSLYDATGLSHPRQALRVGLVPHPSLDHARSLWSDVVEQLGARFIDLSVPHDSSLWASSSRRRPTILVAAVESELTVDVLIAKALGIRIVLPQWLEDAIVLGDFADVYPARHAHPLFGEFPHEVVMAAEGEAESFDRDIPIAPTELLGGVSSSPLANGQDLAPPSPVSPTTSSATRPTSTLRRPRLSEVQFLQKTTAEEFLPVGEQWERPYFRPIFRDKMLYLRSAEELETAATAAEGDPSAEEVAADGEGIADKGQGTTSTRGRRRRRGSTHCKNAVQDAVITLEHVARIVRILGGTVTRNLQSAHIDAVLDLVLDFGQLAAEVGVEAAAAAGITTSKGQSEEEKAEPNDDAGVHASVNSVRAATAAATMPAPCASLSLVYQHAMSYMESYSQRLAMPPSSHTVHAMAQPVRGSNARGHVHEAETDVPPLPVVGLPWLVYSVLRRQYADLSAFVSSRPPPPPAWRQTPTRPSSRACTRYAKAVDNAHISDLQRHSPDRAKRLASPPPLSQDSAAIEGQAHTCTPSAHITARCSDEAGGATQAVDTFLRGFVSPAAKTHASGGHRIDSHDDTRW